MIKLIKMAWRNIWRNKRRTLITTASIFFALFFAIIMRSFQLGTYSHMIKQSIEMFSGYLQVQTADYLDEPNLDHSFAYSDSLLAIIKTTEGVKVAAPRVESFVLISKETQSKLVMVSGIDPVEEAKISNPEHLLIRYKLTPENTKTIIEVANLPKKQAGLLALHNESSYNNIERLAMDLDWKIEQIKPYAAFFEKYARFNGSYLKPNDDGVLISSKLAKFLKAKVGDTLVFLGSGYQGNMAAGEFPLRGIVMVPSPDLDNKLVYMTIDNAREFLSLGPNITSIVINLDHTDQMLNVQKTLVNNLVINDLTVKNWQEINPNLKQQIEGDNKSGKIFVAVLYVIIFFGIFGTVLMMITERRREFGVLVALGMRKQLLSHIVVLEMLFLGLIGIITGTLSTIPLLVYFRLNPILITGNTAKMYEDMGFDPIMPTATVDSYYTWQVLIILIMVLIACYIPLRQIRKMKVMNALRA